MPKSNDLRFLKLIDNISKISPSKESYLNITPEKKPQIMEIRLKSGQVGLLDMKSPRAVHWADVIDYLKKKNRPVYIEIDKETNVITKFLIPQVLKVELLTPIDSGDIEVRLIPSAAIHFLLCSDPDFEVMRDTLQKALDEDEAVLVTETRDEHEIIDVREYSESSSNSPNPPLPPIDPPVSEERAQELFDDMNAQSCIPCSPSDSCIPFKYPDDGCWARAHKMAYQFVAQGEDPEKVWISGSLTVQTSNHPDCQVRWGWHVAPTLSVTIPGGSERRVIDPSLFGNPVNANTWKGVQGDPGAALSYTAWTDYRGGETDPDCTKTDDVLADYRFYLKDRCLEFGPPPYSCTRNCFFILDRNIFSDQEIEAMLHIASPAVIEAAFYIVVDGYKPTELGITSIPSNVEPNLTMNPNVTGMSLEVNRLELEYPTHLNRRQRITWVYNVKFTNTNAFGNNTITVSLTATIASVAGSAYIYLIQQPNPYEIDGETTWLSTDLRIFQIKPNESKFGVAMGSDPSAFITQVISNLNTDNSAGQTFENNISTDQQTSRLELSEKVNGISVYNYAIAKVRYRSLAGTANNVRVFFRLFPVATTSLSYNQSTTYRQHTQGNQIIPLLGISNNEVVSIPCFAAARIDSSSVSMTTQTDPANVIDIPHDSNGLEVARYFGCWLDFNQTQPQFPIQPSPTDGPYSSSRKTIQELIRNQHQCLVAEIAYDDSPIASGSTPSTSDKLAQRNLAIVDSANPGLFYSHRIPHTFEIQPTMSKIEPDEIMIDWGNIPAGSMATIYIAGIDTNDILQLAAKKYRAYKLVRIDENTLKCETGGITYIPLPFIHGNFPGMLTIDLPSTVVEGQAFTVVVRQLSSEKSPLYKDASESANNRQTVGSYQITIPVKTKETMLEPEERLLSNLRWIQKGIPTENRWFPVFHKYVKQIADRVDALGGKSRRVKPSPSGNWRIEYIKCLCYSILLTILLGASIIGIGIIPNFIQAIISLPIAALVLLIAIGYFWIRYCRPDTCSILIIFTIGAILGAITLVILIPFGINSTQQIVTLVLSFVLALIAIIYTWSKKCFKK